jgi:hypothetical protein
LRLTPLDEWRILAESKALKPGLSIRGPWGQLEGAVLEANDTKGTRPGRD